MKVENNWKNKTLENLEGKSWGNASEAPTNSVKQCILLSKIPVSDFSVEDLRLMIGQGFGLPYLVPLAIERLSRDIFVEGDYYPGDLLNNVLSLVIRFWKANKDLWFKVKELIGGRENELENAKVSIEKFINS